MATVSVVYGQQRTSIEAGLYDNIVIVPAAALMFEIDGASPDDTLMIDDERKSIVPGPTSTMGYVLFNCSRSTGYHRLSVGSEVFWFGTVDGKLRLEGMLSIIDYIREEGLSWGKQLLFSDGTSIRDERVDFAWLRSNSEEVLALCEGIADRPASEYRSAPSIRRPTGQGTLVAATTRLLRANPKRLLEQHPNGVVALAGMRWMPIKVVSEKREITHDTISNRRATRLLLDVRSLAETLERSGHLPNPQQKWIRSFLKRMRGLLDRPPFRLLRLHADRIPDRRVAGEVADSKAARVFDLQQSIRAGLGWSPSTKASNNYAYIGYSDEIYQAFVAVVIAQAFDAPKTSRHLCPDLAEPSFCSDRWSIYYDTYAPTPAFSSWRDESCRSTQLTPDYCIVDRENHTGLMGDAKYRSEKSDSTFPGNALLECQHYMQHFDLANFVAFFPGKPNLIERVQGRGKEILIASIVPNPELASWAREVLLPELQRLMTPLDRT